MRPEHCKGAECDRRLVSPSYYRRAIEAATAADVYPHAGHGLCKRCMTRQRRNGTTVKLKPAPRPRRGSAWRPLEDTLEEWEMLRDSNHTLEQAAQRMNMSVAALSKALERARARGDKRGNVPGIKHRRPA